MPLNSTGSGAISHQFQLPTHRLHYLTWGEEGQAPLVLVHGGLDFAGAWEDLAAILARDWHVFAMDLRGHGDSDWSSTGDYLPASYLGDIARFLKEVVGGPAPVVGHSMGARLSLQLMGAMPEAVPALVAIEGLGGEEPDPDPGIDAAMQKWVADRARRAARSDVDQLGDWLRARIVTQRTHARHADLEGRIAKQLADAKKALTPAQAEMFVRGNMRKAEDGWEWKFDPLARWQASHELVQPQAPFYQAIRGPVLHIYGGDSWVRLPDAAMLAHFRDTRLAVIPGGGHWVHLNQPEAVAAEIAGFLAPFRSGQG